MTRTGRRIAALPGQVYAENIAIMQVIASVYDLLAP